MTFPCRLKNALEREGMLIGTAATQPPGPAADPLPWWRPHRLDNGEWGSQLRAGPETHSVALGFPRHPQASSFKRRYSKMKSSTDCTADCRM